MLTFTYENIENMYLAIKQGVLQQEILMKFQDLEDVTEVSLDQNNLYEYFDAEFDDFSLDAEDLKNPDRLQFKNHSQKKEAAIQLHELIKIIYQRFKSMSKRDKQILRINMLIDFEGANLAFKEISEYCNSLLGKDD